MKKSCVVVVLALALALLFNVSPTRADYSAFLGSVSWTNQGDSVYDVAGNPWEDEVIPGDFVPGDDFSGAGEATVPPYEFIQDPPLELVGGLLDFVLRDTNALGHNDLSLPNYDSSGAWLRVYDAEFIANVQTGPPDPGYNYGIFIENLAEDDLVGISVGTAIDDSCSFVIFSDEVNNFLIGATLSELGMENYTSLGLRISIDDEGYATPYLWVNPPDGILAANSPNWIQFGSSTTQIVSKTSADEYRIFAVVSTNDAQTCLQPDLAGTWFFHSFGDAPAPGDNNPDWTSGTITVDATGTVTGGSIEEGDGLMGTVTGGSLSVSSAGVFTGSVVTDIGGSDTITNIRFGKLDAGNTIGSFVGDNDAGLRFQGVMIKDGGTFLPDELAGTWFFHSFGDAPASGDNNPDWTSGTITVDDTGTVTGGNIEEGDGLMGTVTGGSLLVDSAGEFTGSVVTSIGTFITTTNIRFGKLDAGKTIGSFVGDDDAGLRFQGIMIKGGGTFSPDDLAGTWFFQNFGDAPTPGDNNPDWTSGTITVDATGTVTGGSIEEGDGLMGTVTGGSLLVDPAGEFTGSVVTSIGGFITTTYIRFGKLDASHTIGAFVGDDDAGLRFQGVLLKVEPAIDGVLGESGGMILDSDATGAAFSVGSKVLPDGTAVSIEVIPNPGANPPPGFQAFGTEFVNITLIDNPSPLPSPGATITLPVANPPLPDGTPLSLSRYDPTSGTFTLVDTGIVGTVNPGGATATFSGVTDFSIFVALTPLIREVDIDIRPFRHRNVIVPWKWGLVPVAILSTADFNAPDVVDRISLTFGRTGDELSRVFCLKRGRDVNRDGYDDLVAFFRTGKAGFQPGDAEGILRGTIVDGMPIKGSDSVIIKERKKWAHWKWRR